MDVPNHLREFAGIQQIIEIKVDCLRNNKESRSVHYGITSLSSDQASPKELMSFFRGHWSIENNLHHTRDVILQEDHSTIRSGSAPQAMAALRNMVVYLARKMKQTVGEMLFMCGRFYKRAIKVILNN
jgi:predicted transposase YbfD/YdcC